MGLNGAALLAQELGGTEKMTIVSREMEVCKPRSLLSLPREIIEEVIKYSVQVRANSLKRAFRLRLICKTMEPMVMNALYRAPFIAERAMTQIKSPHRKRFTNSEAMFWAQVHVRKIGIRSKLPMYTAVMTLVDNFCDISGLEEEEEREKCLLAVCNPRNMAYFAPRCPGFEMAIPDGTASPPGDLVWLDEEVQARGLLVMCCLFNNRELLEEILGKQPEYSRGHQDYLIRLAARCGNASVVAAFLNIEHRILHPKIEYLICEAALGGSTEVLDVLEESNILSHNWQDCIAPWPLTGIDRPEFFEYYLNSKFYSGGDSVLPTEEYDQAFRQQIAIWSARDNQVGMVRYIVEEWGISDCTWERAIVEAAEGYATEAMKYLLGIRPPEAVISGDALFKALVHTVNHGSLEMTQLILGDATGTNYRHFPSSDAHGLFMSAIREEHAELLRLLFKTVDLSEEHMNEALIVTRNKGLELMRDIVLEERKRLLDRRVTQDREVLRVRAVKTAQLRRLSGYLALFVTVGFTVWSRTQWKRLSHIHHTLEMLKQITSSILSRSE